MRNRLLGLAAGALLLLASPVVADQQIRITSQVANIHSKPDSSSQVLFVARADQLFQLISNQGDWLEIATAQGIHGFVFHNLAEVVRPAGAVAPPSDNGQPVIDHNPVGCLVAGKFPKLDAGFVPVDVARARIYFKAGGTTKWYYVEMTTEAGRRIGILPKPKKTIQKIDYYVSGLSKTSLEGRTQDYSPDVVEKEEQCGSKPKAAYVPQANVVVGGGIPEGFELAGILAEGVGATTAGVAASHTTALLIGGGVVVAGGATAVIVHNSNSTPPCTDSGFTFHIDFGFTGGLTCSATNTTQQNYVVTNKTCKTLTINSLGVAYAFSGACGTNQPHSENLDLNGGTAVPVGKTVTIRMGAPAQTARTFCCPTPPCANGTCAVQETFTLQTSAGAMSLTNSFSVTSNNDCPSCGLPHADAIVVSKGLPTMCFAPEGQGGH
jgi:hypothetical protein